MRTRRRRLGVAAPCGRSPAARGVATTACTATGSRPLPGLRIVASTVPTGTLLARCTTERSITPSSNTSISMAPFSVSTTAMMSPRATGRRAASATGQRARLHVGAEGGHAELDHRDGRSVDQRAHGVDDRRGLRERGVFEVLGIGNRHLGGADAGDRARRDRRRPTRRFARRSPPTGCRSASPRRRRRRDVSSGARTRRSSSYRAGASVRRSITSASMPSAASVSAAASAL